MKKVKKRGVGRPVTRTRGRSMSVDGGIGMAFLARILSRMEELHLTRTSLADRMDVSAPYVSKVLSGNINISFGTAAKLAHAVGMDFEARLVAR